MNLFQTIQEAFDVSLLGRFNDLYKVFHGVPHKIQLLKLKQQRVDRYAIIPIKSYLLNSCQVVRLATVTFAKKKISMGVSQSSVLVWLLFLIYFNNLQQYNQDTLFADVTTIACKNTILKEQ